METWVLVAWLVSDPTNTMSLGTFPSEAACAERQMWLDEPLRKKAFRRKFICVEIVTTPTCEPPAEP